jgi:hypothetical protein
MSTSEQTIELIFTITDTNRQREHLRGSPFYLQPVSTATTQLPNVRGAWKIKWPGENIFPGRKYTNHRSIIWIAH